jgi:hypothetical protein
MSRIIIENRSEKITDAEAVSFASAVMALGRISNNGKQYCLLVVKTYRGDKIQISSDLNKRSDRFVIVDEN